MDDRIASMSHEEFVIYMKSRVLTEGEIAEKIMSYDHPSSAEKLDLTLGVREFLGGAAVMGQLRTALRHLSGLEPIPGD
jgi:hypothetical protein